MAPAQSTSARSSIIARRKRAASPPVQARWSKVNDSGTTLCDSKPPITGVIWWRPRPAATIATVGGTTIGVAYRPANMPKFDSEIV